MLKKLVLISIIIIIFQNIVFSQTKNFEVKSSTALAFTPSVEDITTTSISPILIFNYKLGKDYVIGAKLGASFVILNRKDYTTQNSFDIGNIILKGGLINAIDYYNIKTDATLNFGVPLATFPGNIPDNRLTEFNYNNANSAYGWADPYIWLMNVVPITIETNSKVELNKELSLLLKVEPGYLIAVNSRPSGTAMATNLEAKYSLGQVNIRLGWKSYITSISMENNNYDQNSLSIGTNFKLFENECKTDFNLNIDYPNGLAENTPKPFWGVVISYNIIN